VTAAYEARVGERMLRRKRAGLTPSMRATRP
jgi:hypothetical protein